MIKETGAVMNADAKDDTNKATQQHQQCSTTT